MHWDWIDIVIIVFCLLASGFFSSSETALFALDETKLKKMKDKDDKKRIRELFRSTSLLLITILFGCTLVNTAVESLLGHAMAGMNHWVSTLLTTLIVLLFGEIIPKTVALYRVEQVAVLNSHFLYPLHVMIRPVARLLEMMTDAIVQLAGKIHRKNEDESMNTNHLAALQSIVAREDLFDKEEKELVESVLKFAGREVWNIMTPRTKIISIEQEKPVEDVIALFKKTRFGKLPVYRKTNDEIVGVIFLPTVIPYLHDLERMKGKKAKDMMETIYYVPETKKLSEMLEDFRKKHIRIAAVVDEYGYSLGIVTITDVLGEIVGELIDDSFRVEKRIVRITRNKFLVRGDTGIDDFNSYFETDLSSEEYETIAGYVIEQRGDIPERGETFDIGSFRLTVMEKSAKHIETFSVEKIGDRDRERVAK